MKLIRTEEAVGHVLCHDMTQIIKDQYKDARFRKGHIVTAEDIPVLLSMGKEQLYVWELQPGFLHENDAAERLCALCQSANMRKSDTKEGKIELSSDIDGVFLVDTERLNAVNSIDEIMIATRRGNGIVHPGDKLCGTRVIPLVVREEVLEAAERAAREAEKEAAREERERAKHQREMVEDVVDAIIADVRARGDDALKDYALKFDGAAIENLQVTQAEIDEAFAGMDPYFLETLRQAAENIEQFHRQQVHKNFVVNDKPGIVLGQKYTPIEKAGVYVPGGTAAYPSTVLMDVIPAKVAGVSEIVMTTPAGKDGRVNPVILAAAATAGVTKIFKTGGAQAVAALAYGTQSIPAVDKIVGPGNIYVATAKRKVFGKVGIDMIAGPSEILVLADGGCNPAWVAADLLSQAEHDKLASPVLVTDSPELAKAVQAELEVQIPQLPRAAIARASVDDNGKIILCTDLHKAIEACNIIAPEHLEVCVEDPFGVLNEIKNAGSIFLGRNVPEALGDYFAGPNHTLPTSGTARFSSPLGVDDFVKKSSFLYYTREALGEVAPRIADFAEREGLHAHARSVTIRYEK